MGVTIVDQSYTYVMGWRSLITALPRDPVGPGEEVWGTEAASISRLFLYNWSESCVRILAGSRRKKRPGFDSQNGLSALCKWCVSGGLTPSGATALSHKMYIVEAVWTCWFPGGAAEPCWREVAWTILTSLLPLWHTQYMTWVLSQLFLIYSKNLMRISMFPDL